MEDYFSFYNPLNNNNLTVYILLGVFILLLFVLPDRMKIFSTKGVAITFVCLLLIIIAHQVPFIKEMIPYF